MNKHISKSQTFFFIKKVCKLSKTGFLTLFSFLLLSILGTNVYAQYSGCDNCGANYPSGTPTNTSSAWSNLTTCSYSGNYSYQTLTSGYIYQYDSHTTSYDTQLTLYPSGTCGNGYGGYALAYNDDYNGNNSTIAYTPGTTSVRTLFSMYNCTAYGSGNTCGTLRWRAIPMTPTISASATTICSGGSVTLTASNINASADDYYMDCLWGSTSGGAEYGGGGQNDALRSITINNITSSRDIYLRYRVNAGGSPGTQYSNVASVYITVQSTVNNPGAISLSSTPVCPGTTVTVGNTTSATTGTPASAGPYYKFYYNLNNGTGGWVAWQDGASATATVPATVTNTPGTHIIARNSYWGCAGEVSATYQYLTVNSLSTAPASINVTSP